METGGTTNPSIDDPPHHCFRPPPGTSPPSDDRDRVQSVPLGRPCAIWQLDNNAYHEERISFWKGGYPEYPQSRPAIAASKIHSGMKDYNLQRASKYGNVCHDCAAVLELAPGLLIRNYRKKEYTEGDFLPKLKVGDENYVQLFGRDGNTFWTQLLQKHTDEKRGNKSADYIAKVRWLTLISINT